MLSKTESKMVDFLSNSNLPNKNIKLEQDRIKSLIEDISHQIKTPIANILLYSELLKEKSISPENMEIAENISTQSEKLDFLVASLIKMSRLEHGVISLLPVSQNITPMIQEALQMVKNKANSKNIRFDFNDNIIVNACFDYKWTVEAVYNIIDNAVKYTKESDTIAITIELYEMFARIDISDNGIGISKDELSKIFLRFYRSADVSTQEGVGLGLYLCRNIMIAQSGYLKVNSEKGVGSRFSIFIKR